MTVKTYDNLLDEMKELAEKINKHYDTVTLETVEELDTPKSEEERILNELRDKGVLKESDLEEVDWKNIPKWPTNKKGGIEYDEIGSQSDPTSEKFVHKQFMEVSNRLDWIAERFSEDSMLARKTGEIGGDTGGFGKVSQAADMLLSAVEELHQDAMGHIHQESIREEPEMCSDECCGKTIKECDCGPDCQHCDCYEKKMSEGYQTMPSIDRDRYDEIKGLEGPFMTLSGKVVYYDPKEGKYYDRDSDMYLDYDEWKKYDSKPDWASKEED